MTRPLRFALPKGRLLPAAIDALGQAGFAVPDDDDLATRRLVFDKDGMQWILVKDADVPVYVEHGAADAGIAGYDQILEQQPDVIAPLSFDFGRCRMMLIGAAAAPPIESLSLPVVATKYAAFTRRWLRTRRLSAEIVPLSGSVELAAVLSLAPYIVDLVETGETIRVHGLRPIETIEEISPRFIVNRNAFRLEPARVRQVVEALEKVGNDGEREAGREMSVEC
jgi:ATP phosphoribosyltransferase